MNTVEELRRAFAQEHVLKGVDWIFDLARALEERVERIELANIANAGIRLKEQEFLATVEERIEALGAQVEKLERRMNRFELVHEQHVAQAIESRNQRDERIEALEKRLARLCENHDTNCYSLLNALERIDKLEALGKPTPSEYVHHDVGFAPVVALVKAARAIDETALSQALTGAEWKALVMDLRAALKLFEVKP